MRVQFFWISTQIKSTKETIIHYYFEVLFINYILIQHML